MSEYTDSCSSDDGVISLVDIWQKLVQYKKVFWSIFFTAFIISGRIALLTSPKYTFSQVIEIGKFLDEKGQSISVIGIAGAITKIKKVFYSAAVRAYNLQAAVNMREGKRNLVVENAGNGALVLSMKGSLKDSDKCKFILQKVIGSFTSDTKEYIDHRKKTLTDLKLNLEHRLTEINVFYKVVVDSSFYVDAKKQQDGTTIWNKIMSMYFNDQNAAMIDLTNSINMLQAQILGTYDTRVISDFTVSDLPVGSAKSVLLVLVIIASLFFAFFGVFITNFVTKFREHGKIIRNGVG